MKTVGLVGGLGPESTVDYYRRILGLWSATDPNSAPHLIIDSLDVNLGLRLVANDRPALIEYLVESIERLADAGADFVAITANTPHIVFDDIVGHVSVPMLSIVDACVGHALSRGLRNVLLLGTRFTMEASFYPDVFGRSGINVVVPEAEDRVWIHDRYVSQLLKGDFRTETRLEFESLIGAMREARGVDAVVLGGTEIPLLLQSETVAGIPLLDTTAIHVRAIVDHMRDPSTGSDMP